LGSENGIFSDSLRFENTQTHSRQNGRYDTVELKRLPSAGKKKL
jgi:hypothetical protein